MEPTTSNPVAEVLGLEAGSFELLNLLQEADSKFLRDSKLNLKSIFKSRHLSTEESILIAIACSVAAGSKAFTGGLLKRAEGEGIPKEKTADAIACGSLLTTNNVLYRFRHMVGHDHYDKMPAGIRMQIMMNPTMGKELFELASIGVSAINGCEICIKAHENSVLEQGGNRDRVFEAIKIASVVGGLATVF